MKSHNGLFETLERCPAARWSGVEDCDKILTIETKIALLSLHVFLALSNGSSNNDEYIIVESEGTLQLRQKNKLQDRSPFSLKQALIDLLNNDFKLLTKALKTYKGPLFPLLAPTERSSISSYRLQLGDIEELETMAQTLSEHDHPHAFLLGHSLLIAFKQLKEGYQVSSEDRIKADALNKLAAVLCSPHQDIPEDISACLKSLIHFEEPAFQKKALLHLIKGEFADAIIRLVKTPSEELSTDAQKTLGRLVHQSLVDLGYASKACAFFGELLTIGLAGAHDPEFQQAFHQVYSSIQNLDIQNELIGNFHAAEDPWEMLTDKTIELLAQNNPPLHGAAFLACRNTVELLLKRDSLPSEKRLKLAFGLLTAAHCREVKEEIESSLKIIKQCEEEGIDNVYCNELEEFFLTYDHPSYETLDHFSRLLIDSPDQFRGLQLPRLIARSLLQDKPSDYQIERAEKLLRTFQIIDPELWILLLQRTAAKRSKELHHHISEGFIKNPPALPPEELKACFDLSIEMMAKTHVMYIQLIDSQYFPLCRGLLASESLTPIVKDAFKKCLYLLSGKPPSIQKQWGVKLRKSLPKLNEWLPSELASQIKEDLSEGFAKLKLPRSPLEEALLIGSNLRKGPETARKVNEIINRCHQDPSEWLEPLAALISACKEKKFYEFDHLRAIEALGLMKHAEATKIAIQHVLFILNQPKYLKQPLPKTKKSSASQQPEGPSAKDRFKACIETLALHAAGCPEAEAMVEECLNHRQIHSYMITSDIQRCQNMMKKHERLQNLNKNLLHASPNLTIINKQLSEYLDNCSVDKDEKIAAAEAIFDPIEAICVRPITTQQDKDAFDDIIDTLYYALLPVLNNQYPQACKLGRRLIKLVLSHIAKNGKMDNRHSFSTVLSTLTPLLHSKQIDKITYFETLFCIFILFENAQEAHEDLCRKFVSLCEPDNYKEYFAHLNTDLEYSLISIMAFKQAPEFDKAIDTQAVDKLFLDTVSCLRRDRLLNRIPTLISSRSDWHISYKATLKCIKRNNELLPVFNDLDEKLLRLKMNQYSLQKFVDETEHLYARLLELHSLTWVYNSYIAYHTITLLCEPISLALQNFTENDEMNEDRAIQLMNFHHKVLLKINKVLTSYLEVDTKNNKEVESCRRECIGLLRNFTQLSFKLPKKLTLSLKRSHLPSEIMIEHAKSLLPIIATWMEYAKQKHNQFKSIHEESEFPVFRKIPALISEQLLILFMNFYNKHPLQKNVMDLSPVLLKDLFVHMALQLTELLTYFDESQKHIILVPSIEVFINGLSRIATRVSSETLFNIVHKFVHACILNENGRNESPLTDKALKLVSSSVFFLHDRYNFSLAKAVTDLIHRRFESVTDTSFATESYLNNVIALHLIFFSAIRDNTRVLELRNTMETFLEDMYSFRDRLSVLNKGTLCSLMTIYKSSINQADLHAEVNWKKYEQAFKESET